MRPARIPATRVKIVPWYYTEKNPPSRLVDITKAIEEDLKASEEEK